MDLVAISSNLAYLATLVLCSGIVIGVVFYSKLTPVFRTLVYYFILALVFDILCKTVGKTYNNTMLFIATYGFFELLFFTYLYSRFMFEKRVSIIVILIGALGLAAITYDCLSLDYLNMANFQTYSRIIGDFLIVVFSMVFFFVKLSKGTNPGNRKIAFNTIILLYFSLHLIFFIPINYLINATTSFIYAFLIGNIILTTLFYVFLTQLIWKNGKTPKHLRSGSES